ncbi:MAG: endonuclease [Prevotella sp.]|nr:endonuclease [Prevotella sp.]
MKRLYMIWGLLFLALAAHAIDRSKLINYASSLNGKKKEALKTAVYNIIRKNDQNPSNEHIVLDYGNGKNKTWWGFWYTDRITGTQECINRYSDKKFYFESKTSNSGKVIDGMNIEHSFPKSWWGGTENSAYKDLFNLYPSDTQANSDKSNYPMGVVEQVSSQVPGYDKVGKGTIDGVKNTWCWEPGDQYKGDFSRAYMYMATRYQNYTWSGTQGKQQLVAGEWPTLKQWAYTLYMQWVRNDPVDQLEIDRNEAVYNIQYNRNLFVDFPYLAEYIWGDSINVAFNPYTSITTAVDDDRYLNGGSQQGDEVAPPVFSPEGGTYAEAVTVTISAASDVTILYTTDGTSPADNGTEYESPILITETTTIKAVAVDDEGNVSDVVTATYVIGQAEEDIFIETFDLCDGTGGNSGGFSGSVASSANNFKPDNEGWSAASYFGGDKCARFGSSKKSGVVTTPTFNINGEATFSFKAAPWGTDGTSLTLSVSGNATLSETNLTMKAGGWTEYTVTLEGNGEVAVTFTPALRFFLDEVNARAVITTPTMAGDVNRDGKANVSDVMLVVNMIMGNIEKDPVLYDLKAADANGDGIINITDAMVIVNIALQS